MVCGGVATPYHTLPPRKPKSRETDPDGFDWDRHPHTPRARLSFLKPAPPQLLSSTVTRATVPYIVPLG